MNFSHRYYKLKRKVFPSVRSVNYMNDNKLKIGDFDKIFVKGKLDGNAKIIAEEGNRIMNMSLAFLKYDSESHETHIETVQEYIDLLNSFIRPWSSNKSQTIKSIIWLMWK